MDSQVGTLRERIGHACSIAQVLAHAAEGTDARTVVREADLREVEERLLLCEPGDERAGELLDEWERRWRDLAGLASAPRPRV